MTLKRTSLIAVGLAGCVILLACVGCGEKPFAIVNQKIVRSVSAQGKPGEQTNVFTTQDKAAYCYFEYRNAPPNTNLRGEMTYVEQGAPPAYASVEIELRPGSGKASFHCEPLEGDTLAPGTYEVQLYKGEQELFGSPLRFEVVEATKESDEATPADAA
ncbi:MAG: hypothetical protein ACE5O2_05825 [Armatimonadota bacterium]